MIIIYKYYELWNELVNAETGKSHTFPVCPRHLHIHGAYLFVVIAFAAQ
jgi:hypothetical protein